VLSNRSFNVAVKYFIRVCKHSAHSRRKCLTVRGQRQAVQRRAFWPIIAQSVQYTITCSPPVLILIILTTRLPYNLRPTTRKSVHLVTSAYFRSCDKDGGHTNGSTVVENSMLHVNSMAVCFMKPELLMGKDCRKRDFQTFFCCCRTFTLTC